MENAAELLAVVISTHQTSSTLLVTVTVSLSLHTGVTGSAAPTFVNIPSLTSRSSVHVLGPGPHAAVVLGVEHGAELLAVVVAAHQAAHTLAAVVTVPLALLAGIISCAAPASVHIPALTPGPSPQAQGGRAHHRHVGTIINYRPGVAWIEYHDGVGLLHQGAGHVGRFPLTTVVLLMIVGAELFAVVRAAHQIPLTARVTVMLASISPSITVTLSLIAGLAGGAAAPLTKVTARASLTWKFLFNCCLVFGLPPPRLNN